MTYPVLVWEAVKTVAVNLYAGLGSFFLGGVLAAILRHPEIENTINEKNELVFVLLGFWIGSSNKLTYFLWGVLIILALRVIYLVLKLIGVPKIEPHGFIPLKILQVFMVGPILSSLCFLSGLSLKPTFADSAETFRLLFLAVVDVVAFMVLAVDRMPQKSLQQLQREFEENIKKPI